MTAETLCRYVALDQPRMLYGRHHDACADDRCPGCQPCVSPHCVVCGIQHAERVCAGCVAETRTNLAQVVRLCTHLRDQAAHAAGDGRLLAAAPIPGGDAMVLMAPGSLGAQAADHGHESYADPSPPLLVLATWEDDWRLTFGHPAAGKASIHAAARYLDEQLHVAADRHDAFDEFASEIRHLRGRLEDVLHDGERDTRAAPCLRCGTPLVRECAPPKPCVRAHTHHVHCDQGGLRDVWRCPRCRRTYHEDAYRNAVAATYRAHAPALTSAEIADLLGIRRGTILVWATRGKVRKRGKSPFGRQLYDVDDVRRHAGIEA